MTTPRLTIFDDGQGVFGPLADLRAAFELRSGAQTTLERIERIVGAKAVALISSERLQPLLRQRYPGVSIGSLPTGGGHCRLVNARCASPAALARVAKLVLNQVLLDADGGLVGAHLPEASAAAFLGGKLPPGVQSERLDKPALISRPWHLLDQLDASLRDDLAAIDLPPPKMGSDPIIGDQAVKVSPRATLHPLVVLNAAGGPIVIDHDAVVGSFTVIAGPCYIGPRCIISPHSHIRGSAIGPTCVVGGEVAGSILQGFTNKAHAGYLGDAIVGQWVNLGADTNASNLKNTYGEVSMQLTADGISGGSGRDKLGPVIGDFVRTAIGTRLPTGACVGTGSMLALSAFAPKFVPAMSFLTDKGPECTETEKFLATARRMVARRKQTLLPAEEDLLRQIAQKP